MSAPTLAPVRQPAAPVGPQTYKVEMDAPSPDGQHVSTAAFFPTRVKVRPGDTVTFVVNRNINVSNICTVGCAFCGFGQGKRSPDAYQQPRTYRFSLGFRF